MPVKYRLWPFSAVGWYFLRYELFSIDTLFKLDLLTPFSFYLAGLPPLVLRRVIEILTYLATNHSAVASMLFYLDPASSPEASSSRYPDLKSYKGKEKVFEGVSADQSQDQKIEIPLVIFLKLLNRPLLSRSTTHFEQVYRCFKFLFLSEDRFP